jgi:hypothetical protein
MQVRRRLLGVDTAVECNTVPSSERYAQGRCSILFSCATRTVVPTTCSQLNYSRHVILKRLFYRPRHLSRCVVMNVRYKGFGSFAGIVYSITRKAQFEDARVQSFRNPVNPVKFSQYSSKIKLSVVKIPYAYCVQSAPICPHVSDCIDTSVMLEM